MLIYTYVVRRLKNNGIDLRYILWKEKLKILSKWIEHMQENTYVFGIEPLNISNLQDFYTSIYTKETSQKHNPNVINLIDRFKDRINTDENIQFAFIKKDGVLLAWGIFIVKIENGETIYNLWFRSYEKIKINWLFLGNYIEYFFYKRALENHADYISRGKDRNCYGSIWSNIWLPVHKLQYKFLPYCLWEDNPQIQVDESSIKKEALVFIEPDTNHLYTKAILYTNKADEEIKKQFAVIEKRWISLDVRHII